jgi:hypothetical protein
VIVQKTLADNPERANAILGRLKSVRYSKRGICAEWLRLHADLQGRDKLWAFFWRRSEPTAVSVDANRYNATNE